MEAIRKYGMAETDNDYKYLWPLQEISDAGFSIFAVTNGQKIKIFGADMRTNIPELINMVELDMEDCLSIANELKNYVDHCYEECFR